jgi:hypothetical protein
MPRTVRSSRANALGDQGPPTSPPPALINAAAPPNLTRTSTLRIRGNWGLCDRCRQHCTAGAARYRLPDGGIYATQGRKLVCDVAGAAVAPAPIWRLTATLRLSSLSRSVVGMRPRQCRLGIPGGAARATFRTDTRVLMSWAAKPAPRMRAERLGFVQLVDRISRVDNR